MISRNVLRAAAAEAKAARHVHEIDDANPGARVARRLVPLRHRRGILEVKSALLNQHADQRADDALAHRPALELHVSVRAIRISLGDDATLVHDDERCRQPSRRGEGGVRRLPQLRRVELGGER